jgi:hypothetical protein
MKYRRFAFIHHTTRDMAGLIAGGVSSPGSIFIYSSITFLIQLTSTLLTCVCYGYAWATIAGLVWNIRTSRDHSKTIIRRALASPQVATSILRLSVFFVIAQFCTNTVEAAVGMLLGKYYYGTSSFQIWAYILGVIGLGALSFFLSRYAFDIPLLLANVKSENQTIILSEQQRQLRRNLFLLSTFALVVWTILLNITFGKILQHIEVFDSQTQARFLAVQIIRALVIALPYAAGMVALTVATMQIAESTVPAIPAETCRSSEPS